MQGKATMATPRQHKAAENMVANGGSKAQALRDAGYSEAIARNPQKVTDSQSFQALCEELGLTDNLLVNALVEDIKTKKGERKQELELGFKVKGRLKDPVPPGANQNNPLFILDMSKQDVKQGQSNE
jgi:hypothetical protein